MRCRSSLHQQARRQVATDLPRTEIGQVSPQGRAEKFEHALMRVMAIEEQADGNLLATFTYPHLARAAGEAVHDARKGELDYHYRPGEFLLRVTWKR